MVEIVFNEDFAGKYKKGDKAKYSKDNARDLVEVMKIAEYSKSENKKKSKK